MTTQLPAINQGFFGQVKDRFLEVSTPETFAREVSFAIQACAGNAKLQKCDQGSILQAVYNTAACGLSLNPIKTEAYLVPRYKNNQLVAVLDPDYRGLCKLATDTGSVSQIQAHCVYEKDKFDYELGITPKLSHKPAMSNRGALIASYAIAHIPGSVPSVEVMNREEIDTIRGMSESYKYYISKGGNSDPVWVKWEGEMARKSVIKRLCKFLPKSDKWDKLQTAMKEDSLKYGKAVQGVFNVIKELIEPIEDHLQKQEDFRKEYDLQQIDVLRQERLNELKPYADFVSYELDYGTMATIPYQKILIGVKGQHKAHQLEMEEIERKNQAERDAIQKATKEREKREELKQGRLFQIRPVSGFVPDYDSIKFGEISQDEFIRIMEAAQAVQDQNKLDIERQQKEQDRFREVTKAKEAQAAAQQKLADDKARIEKQKANEKLKKERDKLVAERAKAQQAAEEARILREAEEKRQKEAANFDQNGPKVIQWITDYSKAVSAGSVDKNKALEFFEEAQRRSSNMLIILENAD